MLAEIPQDRNQPFFAKLNQRMGYPGCLTTDDMYVLSSVNININNVPSLHRLRHSLEDMPVTDRRLTCGLWLEPPNQQKFGAIFSYLSEYYFGQSVMALAKQALPEGRPKISTETAAFNAGRFLAFAINSDVVPDVSLTRHMLGALGTGDDPSPQWYHVAHRFEVEFRRGFRETINPARFPKTWDDFRRLLQGTVVPTQHDIENRDRMLAAQRWVPVH